MVEKIGTDTAEKLVGTAKQDDLYGRGGNDIITGLGSNDLLSGGMGNDILNGGDGKDIIRGGRGSDLINGGSNDDVIYALRSRRSRKQTIRDRISELTNGLVSRSFDLPDVLIGGEGKDRFFIHKNKPGNELGFYRGQQYAIIKDFTNGEDKIYLPGTSDNYVGYLYGDNNQDTAILYVENHDGDSSIDTDSGIKDKSLQVPEGTALVAIIENATIRDMSSSDFYTYNRVSIDTSNGLNLIAGVIIGAIAIGSIISLNLRNLN